MMNSGKFQVGEIISEGSYGKVYSAVRDNIKYALKKIRLPEGDIYYEDVVRECAVLFQLLKSKHENVVRMIPPIYQDKGRLCIAFEYANYTLSDVLAEPSLHTFNRKSLLKDILNGVNHCHQMNITHRDLKPSNILIFVQGDSLTAKVADFGLATFLTRLGLSLTPERGTQGYKSHEVLLGTSEYGPPNDMWAVGCIFYEMLTHSPFQDNGNSTDCLMRIFSAVGNITLLNWPSIKSLPHADLSKIRHMDFEGLGEEISHLESTSPNEVDLLKKLLTVTPSERITAEAALQHPYFSAE